MTGFRPEVTGHRLGASLRRNYRGIDFEFLMCRRKFGFSLHSIFEAVQYSFRNVRLYHRPFLPQLAPLAILRVFNIATVNLHVFSLHYVHRHYDKKDYEASLCKTEPVDLIQSKSCHF